MAENTDKNEEILDASVPDASAAPREPWTTPRVLAFERFERTAGPPDMFAMEGLFYGPS